MITSTWVGESTATDRRTRLAAVALALAGGLAIFVVGTPYFELSPANDSVAFNAALAGGFGLAAFLMHRRPALSALGSVCWLLFVAAVAMLTMVSGPFNWLITAEVDSVEHALQDKLVQFLSVVPPIVVLNRVRRRRMPSLYVQAGNVRRWLIYGGAAIVAMTAVVAVVAVSDGATVASVVSLAPWVFTFAALNAVMEELWFRGVFLRPYASIMGPRSAIAVTAIVFGAAHVGATYVSPGEQLAFAALVTGLGVLLAWVIRRTDSIWGGVLVHLGLDLVVMFGFLEF